MDPNLIRGKEFLMTVKLFTNYMGIYISSQKIYENVY